MNRRDFVKSSIATGIGTPFLISPPTVALEFQLSNPNIQIDPDNVDSVAVDIDQLDIYPHYLDDTKTMDIRLKLKIDNTYENGRVAENISFENNQLIDLDYLHSEGKSVSPVIVELPSSDGDLITGDIEITIEHPSIGLERYKRAISITQSGPQLVTGFEDTNLFDRWTQVRGNSGDTVGRTTTTINSGSHSLRVENGNLSGSTPRVTSNLGDGLGLYPTRNSKFQYFVYNADNSGNKGNSFLSLRQSGTAALVQFKHDSRSDSWDLLVRDSTGSDVFSKSVSGAASYDREWIRVVLDMQYDNNVVEFQAYDKDDNNLLTERYDGEWSTDSSRFAYSMGTQGHGDVTNVSFFDDFTLY